MPDCQSFLRTGVCSQANCESRHIRVCQLCECICTDNSTFDQHLAGKQHRFRRGAGGQNPIWCEFCRQSLRGTRLAHEQHRQSLQHQNATRDLADPSSADARLCDVCNLHVRQQAWGWHLGSQGHKRKVQFAPYRAMRLPAEDGESETLDFGVIEVDSLEREPEVSQTIAISIPPSRSRAFLLRIQFESAFRKRKVRAFVPSYRVDNATPNRLIDVGEEFAVAVTFCPYRRLRGRYHDAMQLTFEDFQSGEQFTVRTRVAAVVTTGEDFHLLRPVKKYSPRDVRPRVEVNQVVPGPSAPAVAEVQWKRPLTLAPVPAALQKALDQDGTEDEVRDRVLSRGLVPSPPLSQKNYARLFKALLHIEETQCSVDLQQYDIENAALRQETDFHLLAVPGLSEGRPSVIVGDRVLVRPTGDNGKWYEGCVFAVRLDEVKIKFAPPFKQVQVAATFKVQFKLNRLPLRRMHQALEVKLAPPRILFPTPQDVLNVQTAAQIDDHIRRLSPANRKIAGNRPQLQAVASIAHMPPGSAPFIVFGPPGTGKTMTVVEAIRQLTLKNDPSLRILACAPSNSAADLLAERLKGEGMSPSELFRLNAPSRHKEQLLKSLVAYSKLDSAGTFTVPTPEILSQYTVIVSTCLSAAVPFAIGMYPGHFSHIFVDEVGQAMEPEALIAMRTMGGPRTNLIIAGDPKQLGPVCHSHVAENIESRRSGRNVGLGWSYLDRLMELETYSELWRDVTFVKLLKNWRSHESILKFPNEAFYQGELEVHADPVITHSLLRFESLPNKQFPIIFHGIAGQDEREGESPSFFNRDEASLVKKYVAELLQDQRLRLKDEHIGIISPYSAQCGKIRQLLRKQFPASNIKVGSVEEFQGQERRVIIISGVRSKPELAEEDARHALGFVKNPRRFNVAITRAQALLIVIGNPDVLSLDKHWKGFMSHVHAGGGWIGLEPDWNPREPDDGAALGEAIAAAMDNADEQTGARTVRLGAPRGRGRGGRPSTRGHAGGRRAEQTSAWHDAV